MPIGSERSIWCRVLILLLLVGAVSGCSYAKLGNVAVPFRSGIVGRDTVIVVEPISGGRMAFAGGDGEVETQGESRGLIQDGYSQMIVDELVLRGFRARLTAGSPLQGQFLILSGWTSRYQSGQIFARTRKDDETSKLYTHFTLIENVRGEVVAEFEVVAIAPGPEDDHPEMDKHLRDSARTAVRYIASGLSRQY